MYRHWTWDLDKGDMVIVRKLEGNELREELLKQMHFGIPVLAPGDLVYREVKNIGFLDDSQAIITYEFSDMCQNTLGNAEKFEVKILVNQDTRISRSGDLKENFTVQDLKTIEYVPDRVLIYLDQNTVDDEIPTADEVYLGWLDEF